MNIQRQPKQETIAIIAGQLVVGGAERQLYLWLANMNRKRFNPIVITLHPNCGDFWEPYIQDLGIPLYPIPRSNNRLSRLQQIVDTLRPHRPVLIHGWHTFASAYACMSAKILGTKSLGGVRSSFNAIKKPLETKLSQLFCNSILFNSNTAARAFEATRKMKDSSVFVVQNAVDVIFDERDIVRKQLTNTYGIPKDDIWVVSVGRMDPLKHQDILIHLAAKIKQHPIKIHFVLIGGGPELDSLKKLSVDLEVQNMVSFLGELPFASRLLKGFDIFCFPSIDEGLPNVVMESAAAGLPILAWQLPFIEELIEGDDMAILLPSMDLPLLENTLIKLIESPDIQKKLGAKAQAHILSKFSVDKYVNDMTSVYEYLLQD